MAQGDKRLFFNLRERYTSDDMNRLQAIEAAERAALLRGEHNDTLGDWYTAPGLQTPVVSSTPSLVGDVYGGLMVQPDNAGYFLIQPGVAGFLNPAGVGADDNPYRVCNDPGVVTPGVLPFTSNAGGGSPRWDVVECQVVDLFVVAQESRYIFNPATGIASPQNVDKVMAGRLSYRVRLGVVGSGFPGLDPGWMPLAVVCAPAGSASLLTSDVWDVRPLVRERVRPRRYSAGGGTGHAPILSCEYRHRLAAEATANVWTGWSEAEFNGYVAGGRLERSTPSTLAQFGSVAVTGGRAGIFNGDLADNQSTYVLAPDKFVHLVAVFPSLLPRWQRYSQVPVGSGRVPNGPRGILVVTTGGPNSGGLVQNIDMPAPMVFGAALESGCVLASTTTDGTNALTRATAQGSEHYMTGKTVVGVVAGGGGTFNLAVNDLFPAGAKRVLLQFLAEGDNTAAANAVECSASVSQSSDAAGVTFFTGSVACVAAPSAAIRFNAWCPVLPRTVPSNPTLPGTMRLTIATPFPGTVAFISVTCLAWSSSDR